MSFNLNGMGRFNLLIFETFKIYDLIYFKSQSLIYYFLIYIIQFITFLNYKI